MRILIVEDEPDLLRSIAQALREEGYAVDTARFRGVLEVFREETRGEKVFSTSKTLSEYSR